MTEVPGFWESWTIWREAMLVALIAAATLAYLGVWVTVKKVTWVPLALSQVAALGVVLAFLIHDWLDLHRSGQEGMLALFDPAWLSFLAAVSAAIGFGHPRLGGQRGVVVAYLLASAAVLLVGGFVRQDIHDIKAILFGQTVLASLAQVWLVVAAAGLVLILHLLLYRRFLFVSFDPAAAGAAGLKVYTHEVLLYATFAIMLSAATRTLGALPAFGLCVLPAMAGLRLGRSMARAAGLAIAIGAGSAGLGYFLSFHLSVAHEIELSTGASMVAVAGLALAVCWLIASLRRS
jgi:manganese/iron transport system permease protein